MRRLPGRLVLLGHPLGHSLSPRFQNAALRHAGISLTYEAWDVEPADLPAALETLRREAGAGNVTIPYKGAVAAGCAHLTPEAQRVGVVNTFWSEASGLTGDNTDVAGFQALARQVLGPQPSGVSVTLIGAGGAAAAVCAAVEAWPGATLRIVNRDAERAERLAAAFPLVATTMTTLRTAVAGADVVINATPVGLLDESVPVPVDWLRRDAAVIDLAYHPRETAWVRAAKATGHRAADGLEMLIVQGACAFERWFGFAPNIDAMRAALPT